MKRAAALLAATAITLAAYGARGQDRQQEEAQKLFDEGKQLLDAGRFENAIDVFKRVLALYPSVGAYYNIGEAYERLDRPVAAWAAYVEAERMAHTKLDEREHDAHAKVLELEPRLPKLIVQETAPDLRVTIKDPVPSSEFNRPLRRAPGEYELVARATCKLTLTTRIHVPEDGRKGDVVLGPLAADPSCLPPPPDRGRTQRLIGVGVLGAGAVALGVGSVLGLMAVGTRSDLDRECGGDYERCNPVRPAVTDDLNARARTEATISTIAFVAGGALVVTGAIVFFSAPRAGARPSASARGIELRF